MSPAKPMLTRNSAQAGDYPLYYKIQTVIGGIAMHEEMIKEIVADYVEMRAEDIKLDDTLQSLGLDSLDVMDLVVELENAFDIQLEDGDMYMTIRELIARVDAVQ